MWYHVWLMTANNNIQNMARSNANTYANVTLREMLPDWAYYTLMILLSALFIVSVLALISATVDFTPRRVKKDKNTEVHVGCYTPRQIMHLAELEREAKEQESNKVEEEKIW